MLIRNGLRSTLRAKGRTALFTLLLFALLFVGRQRKTVQILDSPGTPKGGMRLWLLSGAGCCARV